ncbi:MAG: hypothetical protein LBQ60_18290 [Bacteroidales bacterium]|jgi:hypothetical protein|nr:hypothetical protein [Bacteroidales bacterium]
MTGKTKKIPFLICIVVCLFTLSVSGRTYFVDAFTGNDYNSGLSPDYAWQTLRQVNQSVFKPGDSILFRSGQQWFGMLFPQGSGTEEQPIVISKYGGEKLPCIHGGEADPVYFEEYRTFQAVLLRNQQYWEIRDLEITNIPGNRMVDFDNHGNDRRRGIYVVASDTGELKGITIRNNYIHHVKGNDTKDFHGSGGILLAVIGKEKPSFFNGVDISGNRMFMINRTGICVSSYWQRRLREKDYPYSWMDEMGEYQANLNIVIRGNDLESIGGDGIVPQVAFKASIEYNKVNGAASRSKEFNAALWAWNSDSVLIRYNEVWNTRSTRDGMAFDCDAYSIGHTYQYNFSHDNEGGFLLLHGSSKVVPDAENIGHLIRNNISMNDRNILLQFHGSGHTHSIIENNLFYNTVSKVHPLTVDGYPRDIRVQNNIFYLTDMGEWKGEEFFLNFYFSRNMLFDASRSDISRRIKNKFKRPLLADVYEMFGIDHSLPRKNITPEDVRMLWKGILSASDKAKN